MIINVDNSKMKCRNGFSLIEIAIVLVIIGLMIGGVLSGKKLIESIYINAQIAQLTEMRAAINNFKQRTNGGLPGDYSEATLTINNSQKNGDGDGLIEASDDSLWSEPLHVWEQLSALELLDKTYQAPPNQNAAVILGKALPLAKINSNTMIFLLGLSSTGKNYFYIGLGRSNHGHGVNFAHAMTASQASAIDVKIDDGKPDSGDIIAVSRYIYDSEIPTNCVSSDNYQINNNNISCRLRINF